jgi:hypothetical protein
VIQFTRPEAVGTLRVHERQIRFVATVDRSFEDHPDAGEAVGDGQLGVGMLDHVGDGKVVGEKGIGEAAESEGDEAKVGEGGGTRERHPGHLSPGRADDGEYALHAGDAERQDQREMSEFRNHRITVFSALRAWSRACCASGGM